ncbi:D-Ala-D-Ala carboxypeptidase family metallohydrolase [Sphingosinicella terrae]|uniref:D-Ala-D-Ala carboxypeptidase family metallohydrolase n=1 Tax=Sphingosinicella terrae TaxID=2172047 RepID=UPI000E0CFC36|nr:D-Ala-D-Ala carboxypeptidase family metallohydrolase [Sphingosinicella terrae]
MIRPLLAFLLAFLAIPAAAQELPEGQGQAEYEAWLAQGPAIVGQVLSFEAWQDAAGVRGVLPTWQMLRTASMWRECGGQPFEVPPHTHWPDMVRTLKFIRDHVKGAVGEVEAVSGYRNPVLNRCARGSARSAHLDFFALDLVPVVPLDRAELFRRLCTVHARAGRAAEAGLGFYSFQRFHVDSRGFRRWGSAGPRGNESPCAILERGGDPLAPPFPPPTPPIAATPPRPAPAPLTAPPSTPPPAPPEAAPRQN